MKKILCIVLLVTLCFNLLTACKKREDATGGTATPEQSTAESTSTENTEGSKKEASSEKELKEEPKENTPSVASENLIATMSEGDKTRLNKFISNFTEAHCSELGPDAEYDDFKKVSFAYVHNLINNPDQKIIYNDLLNKFGIEHEMVDETLKKFFGESIKHKTVSCVYKHKIEGKEVTNEVVYEYADGIYWLPAASGESYEYFAIVTDMRDNGDGTYDVIFNEYFDETHLHQGMQPEWYSYTADEASTNCLPAGKGTAKISKKEYDGKQTYELISFKAE